MTQNPYCPGLKVLHTRGRGVGCQASHLPLYLPLYSPVWFFGGLVWSTNGVISKFFNGCEYEQKI